MMLRLLSIALLLLGHSDALLRGGNYDDEPKKMRRKLGMDTRKDDPCDAQAIEQDLSLFGFTGQQLIDLTESAVKSCQAQLAAIRDGECLCYDDAVGISQINSLDGGNRRVLQVQQPRQQRSLAVIPSGKHCSSNSDCPDPSESCMVGPYTWVCSTPEGFMGAQPLCDEGATKCGGATVAP